MSIPFPSPDSLKKLSRAPSVAKLSSANGSVEDVDGQTLSPELIVELLINEFGALADPDGEPEQLLIEENGAFLQDVAILVRLRLLELVERNLF